MIKYRYPLWRSFVVMLLGATMMAARCPAKKKATPPAGKKLVAIPDSADQVGFGMRTVMTDQGVAKGLLLSDSAFIYDDGTRMELRRVHMTFFTPQGLKDGVLTAKTGVYNSRLSRLEVRGDVIVTRDDGKHLTSQQLVYDQARNQIFTDSAFVLDQPPRQQVTGVGFESDPRLTDWRCLRACKGVAPVKVPKK